MPAKWPHAARTALALILATGLAACSNGKFGGGPALEYGLELVGLGGDKNTTLPDPEPSIGPPLLVGYKAIRVALPNTRTVGQNRLFVAPDGVEIAMTNGHVTRVTGLGVDLEGMYLPGDSPYTGNFVEAAKAGAVTDRVADYFRKGDILHDSFRCALTYVPREGNKGIITEKCRRFFGGPGFQNTYWTTGNDVTCSLQWFHPDADKLQFFQTPQQAQNINLNQNGC